MLSKYRMEKANPGMEKARLTSRLNAVQQRIKEVEEQLDEARRNAAFESKYKDDPYWKIAKKRYIETGDPAAIENFRAKQDAWETAEKNRQTRDDELQEQKRQQLIYDELDARRDVQNAVVDYDAASASGDKDAIAKARNALAYAKEHYMQVTGKEYKLPSKYKLEDTESQEGNGNEPPEATPATNWLENAPLYKESGAKNAKEFGAYLLRYADNADGKANKMRLSAANKQLVDDFLAANKDRWADMGLNDQDVARIKSHMSQEAYDVYDAKNKAEVVQLKKKWNELVDKYQAARNKKDEKEMKKLQIEMNDTLILLKKKGVKKPESLDIKISI